MAGGLQAGSQMLGDNAVETSATFAEVSAKRYAIMEPIPTPMLFHAETPHALLHAMAESLAHTRDVRARHWLILPARGRAETVLARWAQLSGIASHSQEVQLRELIEQAAAGKGDRFDFERLRLAVANALPSFQKHPDSPLPQDTPVQPLSAAVLSWADALARAIDQVLLCRLPQERWQSSAFLSALVAHSGVADALQTHIGWLNEATFEKHCLEWIEDWQQRGGLPHLWIQLDAGLPLLQWERLRHFVRILSQTHSDRLHLFFLCPSNEYWGECRLRHKRGARNADTPLENPDFHPGGLLWAFGKSSQDLHIQLADSFLAEADGGTFLPSEPLPDNLLGRLQQSCRNAAPFPLEELQELSPTDSSLTLHAAHSALRELEICRDRILQARADLPDLRYEDILLLLTDPQRQAPLVEAAFRSESSEHGYLPYRMIGSGQSMPGAFSQALTILLQKIRGRLDFEDIQALLEKPLIARKFQLDSAEGENADPCEWLRDAQFRWGSSASHRLTFQEVKEGRWSLAWALQRLALGAIVRPTDTLTPVQSAPAAAESVPLVRATGLELSRLSELARFAAALEKFRTQWRTEQTRSIGEWNLLLRELVETFLDGSHPSANQPWTRLQNVVFPGLERAATAAPCALRADAYIRIVEEKLASLSDSGIRGPGGIQVGDLRQYAGVPARVVLIAGLDDGVFPRRDTLPKWHPLAHRRKTGDPSLRDADRHALLLAVLSCGERLVLSFQGASDEDGKPQPPSTAVSDLLQAIESTVRQGDSSPGVSALVFRHPLNHFSPRAFDSSTDPRARGMLGADFEAASIVLSRTGLPPFPGPWQNPLSAPEFNPEQPQKMGVLSDLLREPAKLVLRRLGLLLPEAENENETGDLLTLGHLTRYQLREEMLFSALEHGDRQALRYVWDAAGYLPRGSLGDEAWKSLERELPEIPAEPLTSQERVTHEIAVSLKHPHVPEISAAFVGTLRKGWYRQKGTNQAFWYTASRRGGKDMLLFQLESLLLACGSGPDLPPLSRTKAFFRRGSNSSSHTALITLPPPDRAAEILGCLLPLLRLGNMLPLPFWPEAFDLLKKRKNSAAHMTPEERAELLRQAFEKWMHADFSGTPPPSQKAATRYAFRGCENPFEWYPDVPESAFLPDPGMPLAWRVFAFLAAWREKVAVE